MRLFVFGTAALCLFGLISPTTADDLPPETPQQSPPDDEVLPTVLEITPASVITVSGLNRGEESWNNVLRLLNATVDWPFDWPYKSYTDGEYGENVVRLDAPLAWYRLQEGGGSTIYVLDRQRALEAAGITADIADFEDGEIIFTYDDWPKRGTCRVFHEDQVYITRTREQMQSIVDAPPLSEELPESATRFFSTADAVYLNRRPGEISSYLFRILPPRPIAGSEPLTEEQQVQVEIRDLLHTATWLSAGLRVGFTDEDAERETPTGATFHTGILFDHAADTEGAKLLAGLSCPEASTLAGLPQGDPLLIFAGEFASDDKLTYYRQLGELGQRYWNRRNRLSDSLATRQFYGLFEEVGEHMQGMRVAAYRNPDPGADGLYSVVFIADADDPAAFIAELQQMMRLAQADEVDLSRPEESVTDAEIEALVTSLGDRLYRVRRDATNRLLVIGLRATPFLEARLADESLELRTRAKVILDHFATLQSDEARHFFGSDLLRQLDPLFRYVVAGETLADATPVDWITVTVPEESQPHVQQLETWLGPDWNRWRLARLEGQIVVCVSSRPELLSETVANLRDPAAPALQVADWNSEENEYQFQLHFDAYELVPEKESPWIMNAELEPGQPTGLTSFGLTIAQDGITCDTHLPLLQLRRLAGWFY
jgi:hypothetical protein